MNAFNLIEKLSVLTDYRQPWKVVHKLSDIVLLVICAVIAGCDGWDEIEDFGRERLDWPRKYGEFKPDVQPSADTIARVMSCISATHFQKIFCEWMKACHTATNGDIIAIDGKTARSSYDKSKKKDPIHMVSAFATANKVVLGHVKTDAKSNEITAIPDLLDLLEIKGCLVTIDAMGCQRKIAEKIVEKEGDYLLAVKGNQGKLNAAFEQHFPLHKLQNWNGDVYTTTEKSHGRTETRMHIVSEVFDEFVNFAFDWKKLTTLGVAIAFRSEGKEAPESVSVRYYISSANLTAEKFAAGVREHWDVENGLHYKLDVAMNEDDCRVRTGAAPEMLASVRRLAINMLNNCNAKGGVRRKMKRAALSTRFLEDVLKGAALLLKEDAS